MLSDLHRRLFRFLPLVGLLILVPEVSGQQAVGVLRTGATTAAYRPAKDAPEEAPVHHFTFERNLIFFSALVDGHPGNFILDTGAPSLIVNDRGKGAVSTSRTGLGAGGEVSLGEYHVGHFEMGQQSVTNYWAISLDLRQMEERTARRIDGFVGYDLLNAGELRIDYGLQRFQLLPSQRRPTYGGLPPRATFKFVLVDHLPVICVRVAGQQHYFALDTGAGANLIDAAWARNHPQLTRYTAEQMNIQGMDGANSDAPIVHLEQPTVLDAAAIEGVVMDLSHLQDPKGVQLAGILGSSFLRQFTVGIDYRRRKVYLW